MHLLGEGAADGETSATTTSFTAPSSLSSGTSSDETVTSAAAAVSTVDEVTPVLSASPPSPTEPPPHLVAGARGDVASQLVTRLAECLRALSQHTILVVIRKEEGTTAAADASPTANGASVPPPAAVAPVSLDEVLPLTPFHSVWVPEIDLVDYTVRMWRYLNLSAETVAYATLYVCRYTLLTGHPLSPRNAHRLVLAAVLLAMNHRADRLASNLQIAFVAGVPVAELVTLEAELRAAILHQVQVARPEFDGLLHAAQSGDDGPASFVEGCMTTYQRYGVFTCRAITTTTAAAPALSSSPPVVASSCS